MFVHTAYDAATHHTDPTGITAAINAFFPWNAGVDIFFIISGFIIIHASAPLFATGRRGVLTFLRRRFTRIIPLYWLATALYLASLHWNHSAGAQSQGGALFIAASFLFIPWPRPDGVMQPAYSLGWTLNYEMFFYVTISLFLLLPRARAIPAAIAFFAALIVLGALVPLPNPIAFWTSPLLLEFCAGMALAQARASGITLPASARLALAAAALILWHINAAIPPGSARVWAYGGPAFLLMAAATLAPPFSAHTRLSRLALPLGAASYALYLFHPFVIAALSAAWPKIHAHLPAPGPTYAFAVLLLAPFAALIIHGCLETRISRFLSARNTGAERDRNNESLQMPGL